MNHFVNMMFFFGITKKIDNNKRYNNDGKFKNCVPNCVCMYI